MTIEAIQERSAEHDAHKLALSICAIDLGHVIEGMIRDGIARQKKGGKYSRLPALAPWMAFCPNLRATSPAFATAREDKGAGPGNRSPGAPDLC
jgi:hypothetical protein